MKRHKNWQEWGRKRVAQHQAEGVVFELVNKAILDAFYEPRPLWKDLQDKHGHLRPFFGGSEMRVPIQFEKIDKQA